MKKLIISLLGVAFMLQATMAEARNLTADEVKQAAAFYLRTNTDMLYVQPEELTLVYQIDNERLGIAASYFYNVGRAGWIIMGANTTSAPVLAYSECGHLDIDNLPETMMLFVEDLTTVVRSYQDAEAYNEKIADNEEWDILLNQRAEHTVKDNSHILMDETWDQNGDMQHMANGTSYDIYTPVIDGKHAPVGCVATALSQIFHYYKFPKQPTGKKKYKITQYGLSFEVSFDTVSFDYDLMANTINRYTPMETRQEMAKLGYMIGVAVEMGYTAEASGASSVDVPRAMRNYFKYTLGTMTFRRSSFTGNNAGMLQYSPYKNAVDDSTFLSRLRIDLKNNRPVYMGGSSSVGSGRDAGGHAWVCCGYRDTNESMYYMNWGWGGIANGWFNLKSNNLYIANQGYNFKLTQECITNMLPPADSVDVDIYAGIADVDNTHLMPAYPNPAIGQVVLPYSIDSDAEMLIYSAEGRLVGKKTLPAGDGKTTVDVSNMPSGIYIYRVKGATGRFIVQ